MFWGDYDDLNDIEKRIPELSDQELQTAWNDSLTSMNQIESESDFEAAMYSPAGAANGLFHDELKRRGWRFDSENIEWVHQYPK